MDLAHSLPRKDYIFPGGQGGGYARTESQQEPKFNTNSSHEETIKKGLSSGQGQRYHVGMLRYPESSKRGSCYHPRTEGPRDGNSADRPQRTAVKEEGLPSSGEMEVQHGWAVENQELFHCILETG